MPPRLRVGTDCSGLDAPAFALRALGVPFDHVFASETDAACVRTLRANHAPRVLYGDPDSATPDGDIRRRDPRDAPACDLYVCGFPCQSFSVAGDRRGLDDPRGSVMFACLAYVRHHRPRWVVFENVKHLAHIDGGAVLRLLLDELRAAGYAVSHAVLNTKDYGVPQSRNRLYVVGERGATPRFRFPAPVPCAPVASFVDTTDTARTESSRATLCRALTAAMAREGVQATFFDQLHMQRSKAVPWNRGGYPYAPCVTSNSYHWNVPMDRRANVRELLQLQGLPPDLRVVVSDTSIRRQIGNAMSCNVLRCIFAQLLPRPKRLRAEGCERAGARLRRERRSALAGRGGASERGRDAESTSSSNTLT